MVKIPQASQALFGNTGNRFGDEHLSFCFRQHWLRLFVPAIRMIIFSVILILAGYVLIFSVGLDDPSTKRTIVLLLVFFFILIQIEFLMKFYAYFLYMIIVTDKRIHKIKKTLFATDNQQWLDLASLQDINKQQRGIVQNLLGFGSLVIEAQETELKIHFTPHIAEHYKTLMRLHSEAQQNTNTQPIYNTP